ncbi:hypothetical protein LIER_16583 [Lithospermum erythrorhizon]|uniref:Reverse transcriptase/retrotransposon-derived protein RNase H-like domain-containing protein n=1 Tax=Lithospermum erythrorhizon TaxID=34254 RepID=A0AAV3QAD2_LITER
MKKGAPYVWDAACFATFQDEKTYLMSPPVARTISSALLAQKNEEGKENSLYYLTRRMTPNELKYTPIEKLCLAVIFSI